METIILWLQPIKNISVIKTLVKKIERVDFREENNFRIWNIAEEFILFLLINLIIFIKLLGLRQVLDHAQI